MKSGLSSKKLQKIRISSSEKKLDPWCACRVLNLIKFTATSHLPPVSLILITNKKNHVHEIFPQVCCCGEKFKKFFVYECNFCEGLKKATLKIAKHFADLRIKNFNQFSLFIFQLNAPAIHQLSRFSNTLRTLWWVDSFNSSHADVLIEPNDLDEQPELGVNPFIIAAWRCSKLTELVVHGKLPVTLYIFIRRNPTLWKQGIY